MFRRACGALLAVWCAFTPLATQAHPLGNFTINHLTQTTFVKDGVFVHYVADLAEIPTYQTMREISPSGKLDAAQLKGWAQRTGIASLAEVKLSVAGVPLALAFDRATAYTRPGAGGLPTLYLDVHGHAPLAAHAASEPFRLEDRSFPGRLGWRDAVIVPETEPTHDLTAYPSALLGSPRTITILSGTLAPDGQATVLTRGDTASADAHAPSAATVGTSLAASVARSNQLSDMIARGTGDWSFVALTFLVAIVLGALHALEPGHGKTLLAVSLVGARATVKQAAILAGSLTIAHTIGVLALGIALNIFKGYFIPETIYPWITLLSGIVIAIIGARAIAREVRRRRAIAIGAIAHEHGAHDLHLHSHDELHGQAQDALHADIHRHAHQHGHAATAHHHGAAQAHTHDDLDDAEHALMHAIPGTTPLKFGPTVWAAMSGGIAPCPAALVVLLAAIALNRVTYGIFVIIAFSFGLAATLTGLGIAVVRGASWLQGRPQFDRFVKFGPLGSAMVISIIGAIMIGQGFVERGAAANPLLVSAMVALAIAGYVLSHPFGHRHTESL